MRRPRLPHSRRQILQIRKDTVRKVPLIRGICTGPASGKLPRGGSRAGSSRRPARTKDQTAKRFMRGRQKVNNEPLGEAAIDIRVFAGRVASNWARSLRATFSFAFTGSSLGHCQFFLLLEEGGTATRCSRDAALPPLARALTRAHPHTHAHAHTVTRARSPG